MKIVSNRDSLHEMSNSVGWKKQEKVSSNILSAEIAQRVVNTQGNPISGYRRLRDFGGKQIMSSSDCMYLSSFNDQKSASRG